MKASRSKLWPGGRRYTDDDYFQAEEEYSRCLSAGSSIPAALASSAIIWSRHLDGRAAGKESVPFADDPRRDTIPCGPLACIATGFYFGAALGELLPRTGLRSDNTGTGKRTPPQSALNFHWYR